MSLSDYPATPGFRISPSPMTWMREARGQVSTFNSFDNYFSFTPCALRRPSYLYIYERRLFLTLCSLPYASLFSFTLAKV
jgi:hypothetical protein